ncbi:hypothetical protein OG730_00100 [Streptomyces sp. NBC_01298]|uniref:hypothetical protein n=1 Tax=Streptomyces sp. NBC_01298 TaxID=2903817 RepID=UPI002E1169FE|nr:hypothetical protein OG730_00100 [Streptomyces sp. NBC_01298]
MVIVERASFEVESVDDGFLTLTNSRGLERSDVEMPSGELGERLQAQITAGKAVTVTVTSAMGAAAVTEVHETTPGATASL